MDPGASIPGTPPSVFIAICENIHLMPLGGIEKSRDGQYLILLHRGLSMQPPTQHLQVTTLCPFTALLLNRWTIIVLQGPMVYSHGTYMILMFYLSLSRFTRIRARFIPNGITKSFLSMGCKGKYGSFAMTWPLMYSPTISMKWYDNSKPYPSYSTMLYL
ncbi:uncharacterized protein ARB_01186 [Trichophyton benhamiae CBS 112371]|uniref:Uncharacterized protein n=1 Tax=Arthroderma benhamiae (strain ATCC MYA-4681 / CBS 112371) TaxID=663331 RepID=D4AYB7_ARTBC|nr:uncharacterized protein ARB_01186 [Trichophyton benhamiae CBS 112371]EFE31933.1 hypothetical protein ARB_01186 [Trichophyton benhamiae CBS 112371]